METLVSILLLGGFIICVVGAIWFIVAAFQEGILWGLGCLFLPFVQLIFLFMHWDKARKPFLIQIVGLVPMYIGMMLKEPSA